MLSTRAHLIRRQNISQITETFLWEGEKMCVFETAVVEAPLHRNIKEFWVVQLGRNPTHWARNRPKYNAKHPSIPTPIPPHTPQLNSYAAKGQTAKADTEKCWCRSRPEPISWKTSLHPSFQQLSLIFSFAQLKTDSGGYGTRFKRGNAVNILSSPVTASLSHKVLKNVKRLVLTMTKTLEKT